MNTTYGRMVRFGSVAREAAEAVRYHPVYMLILSWLHGGRTYEEKRRTTDKNGYVVTVPAGATWGSYHRIAADILHHFPNVYVSEHIVKRAMYRLLRAGLVERTARLPFCLGTIYRVTMQDHEDRVCIEYGPDAPQGLIYREVVNGPVTRRGTYDVQVRDPQGGEQYVSVGAFSAETVEARRKGEDVDQHPVYVPEFVIDIDRDDIEEAYAVCEDVLLRMEEVGYDLDRVKVAFSGRRGFHICVDARAHGYPRFQSIAGARHAISVWRRALSGDHDTDPSLDSPLALVRTVGSRHPKTGLFKVAMRASTFLRTTIEDILYVRATQNVQEDVEPHPPVFFFERVVARHHPPLRRGASARGVIREIVGGVSEGASFGDGRHCGRNKASYIMACHLIDARPIGDPQLEHVRDTQGAFAALRQWNLRNDPPLPYRELRSTYRSAARTLRMSFIDV